MIHWPNVGVCFTVRHIASWALPTTLTRSPAPAVGVQTSSSHVDSCIAPSHTTSYPDWLERWDSLRLISDISTAHFYIKLVTLGSLCSQWRETGIFREWVMTMQISSSQMLNNKTKPPVAFPPDPMIPVHLSVFRRRKMRAHHLSFAVTWRTGICRLNFAEQNMEAVFSPTCLFPSARSLYVQLCENSPRGDITANPSTALI